VRYRSQFENSSFSVFTLSRLLAQAACEYSHRAAVGGRRRQRLGGVLSLNIIFEHWVVFSFPPTLSLNSNQHETAASESEAISDPARTTRITLDSLPRVHSITQHSFFLSFFPPLVDFERLYYYFIYRTPQFRKIRSCLSIPPTTSQSSLTLGWSTHSFKLDLLLL